MAAINSYSTGTVTVADGGTSVAGTSTIWSGVNARPGDVLQIGEFQTIISDVVDAVTLTIPPWGGGDQTGAEYTVWHASPLRYAGADAMADVSRLVAALNKDGFFWFVGPDETEPDPSLGDDGQYAAQPTTGKQWAKVSGTWTFLGVYRGFNVTGDWDSGTDYAVNDIVVLDGSSYLCILAHTNHTPPNATYWQLLASKGDDGVDGANGADGADGATGATGATGPAAWNPPEAWVTATAYTAGPPADVVVQGGETYVCLTSHTSGTFGVDLAAGKWIKVAEKGADGAGGTTAAEKQNAGLVLVYQSKSLSALRKAVCAFADGFKASDGINAGSSSGYALDTTNGKVGPTTSSNTQISTSGKTFVGTMNDGGGRGAAFDGNTSQAHTAGAGNAAGQTGYTNNTIGVDWGSGVTKTVVEFRLWAPNSTAINGGSGGAPIKLQGSNDGSNWTDLYTSPGSVLASASSTLTVNSGITTTTAYRYHQIAINGAGGGSGCYLAEVQFYEAGTLSNMTLVTTAQTADASVNKVRALIEFDNTASLTAGTDFTIEATCNGGTNWTAAGTYTVATSNSQGGRRVIETDEITCTAGTSVALRLKTLTNKNMPVHGLACTWS